MLCWLEKSLWQVTLFRNIAHLSIVTGLALGLGFRLLSASPFPHLLPWWPGSGLRDAAGGTGPGTDPLCPPTSVPPQWLSSTSCGSAEGAELFGSRLFSFWKFSFLRKHQIRLLICVLSTGQFFLPIHRGQVPNGYIYLSLDVYIVIIIFESGEIRGRWHEPLTYHWDVLWTVFNIW